MIAELHLRLLQHLLLSCLLREVLAYVAMILTHGFVSEAAKEFPHSSDEVPVVFAGLPTPK